MAYQVLARKYRPQRFSDVIGQDHVTRTLLNALAQNRVAHGYIFSGHRGIGKTTIARILAMALNCRHAIGSKERPTPEPCGECENCREISAASRSEISIFEESHSFDVEEIDAATRRGIDDAKLLTSKIQTRPTAKSRYRIIILDEAHQITDAAWNSLLKTLEEPPEWAVFMFATTQPEDIPQTVRSRCQHFSFHAVRHDDILSQLRMVVEKEKLIADDAALNLLAEAGDGSMRDALSIMDQAIASAPTRDGRPLIEAAQVRELMGTVPNVVFEEILEGVSANQASAVLTTATRLLDAGNSPAQIARQFVRYLRNTLVAKIARLTPESPASELLQISPDERARAARSAQLFSEEELARFLQVMLRTFDELGYRQEQRLHFELGLVKLVHLQRLVPIEEILSGLPATSSAPASPRSSSSSAPRESVRTSATTSAVSTTPASGGFSPFESDRSRKMSSDTPIAPSNVTPINARSGSVGSLALAPEPVLPAAEPNSAPHLEAVPPAAISAPTPDDLARAQQAAVAALEAQKLTSATHAIEESEWSVAAHDLRIQTTHPKSILSVLFPADAERILKTSLRASGLGAFKLHLLPGAPAATAAPRKPRAPRTGSVEAKAREHPMVQQALTLFKAELLNVQDLRKD